MSDALLDLLRISQADHSKLLLLLQGGCDPNYSNASGMTPLKAAIMNCDKKVVEALILNGSIVSEEVVEFAAQSYPNKPKVLAALRAESMRRMINASVGDCSNGASVHRSSRRNGL